MSCFLVAKDFEKPGCYAVQMELGSHLSEFKAALMDEVGYDRIQLVTLSRPSAYMEYAPYQILTSEEEFRKAVLSM